MTRELSYLARESDGSAKKEENMRKIEKMEVNQLHVIVRELKSVEERR